MSQYKPWFFKGTLLGLIALISMGLGLLAIGSFAAHITDEGGQSWRWLPPVLAVIAASWAWVIFSVW
jgi:hypothetical protein